MVLIVILAIMAARDCPYTGKEGVSKLRQAYHFVKPNVVKHLFSYS